MGKLVLSVPELDAERPRVRDWCAEVIEHHADATRPLTMQDAHNAAVALTLRLIDMSEMDVDGEYVPVEELAQFVPALLLNRRLSDRRRGRVLIHEMATHLQREHVARQLYDAETVECDGLIGALVRHEIARDVEAVLL